MANPEPNPPLKVVPDDFDNDEPFAGGNNFRKESGGGDGGGTVEISMKDYVDAQDEKTRARNDAQFSEVLTGIDKIASQLSAHGDIMRQRLDVIDGDLKSAKSASEDAKTASEQAKTAVGNVKWNIFFTALGVVGVLFVAFQIWMQAIEMVSGLPN